MIHPAIILGALKPKKIWEHVKHHLHIILPLAAAAAATGFMLHRQHEQMQNNAEQNIQLPLEEDGNAGLAAEQEHEQGTAAAEALSDAATTDCAQSYSGESAEEFVDAPPEEAGPASAGNAGDFDAIWTELEPILAQSLRQTLHDYENSIKEQLLFANHQVSSAICEKIAMELLPKVSELGRKLGGDEAQGRALVSHTVELVNRTVHEYYYELKEAQALELNMNARIRAASDCIAVDMAAEVQKALEP